MGLSYDTMFLVSDDELKNACKASEEAGEGMTGEVHGSQVNNIEVSRGGTLLIQSDGKLLARKDESGEDDKTESDTELENVSSNSKLRKQKQADDIAHPANENGRANARRKLADYPQDVDAMQRRAAESHVSSFFRNEREAPPSSQKIERRASEGEEIRRRAGKAYVAQRLAELEGVKGGADDVEEHDDIMEVDDEIDDINMRDVSMDDEPRHFGRRGGRRKRAAEDANVEYVKTAKNAGKAGKTKNAPKIRVTTASPTRLTAGDVAEEITIPTGYGKEVRVRVKKANAAKNAPQSIEITPTGERREQTQGQPIMVGDRVVNASVGQTIEVVPSDAASRLTSQRSSAKQSSRQESSTRRLINRRGEMNATRKLERMKNIARTRPNERGVKRQYVYPDWLEDDAEPSSRRRRMQSPPPSFTITAATPPPSPRANEVQSRAAQIPARAVRIRYNARGRKRKVLPVSEGEDEEQTQIPRKSRLVLPQESRPKRVRKRQASPLSQEDDEEYTTIPYKSRPISYNPQEDEVGEYPDWAE